MFSVLAIVSCTAAILSPTAGAAIGDPLFILKPVPPLLPPPVPPPAGQLEGLCGLAVDAAGDFYVSDYYHHAIDVYSADAGYLSQRANEDPLDGPCGLAIAPAGNVYVNNFHRNAVRFGVAPIFGVGTVIAGAGVDSSRPTGVAVDDSGTVYVDERDRVATFDAAGLEGEPIGVGDLQEGYGVAVSAFPATAGFVYVPDAATAAIKVYDPVISRTAPVAQIDGTGTPTGHFVSLRDAAIAVDDTTGTVYVVDDLTPEYTEGHESVVYAFDPTGVYLGRLKYAIQTALPAGLAVDNSTGSTQGRVYVTSGYTELAEVYAYPPGSAGSTGVPLPNATGARAAQAGTGASPVSGASDPGTASSGSGALTSSPVAQEQGASMPAVAKSRASRRAQRTQARRISHRRHHKGRRPAGRKGR